MHNFRTYQLSIQFYQEGQKLKLKGPVKAQFDRASYSIISNLAEGSAKPTAADRRKYYYIALGSLRESQVAVHLFGNQELIKLSDCLGAHLYRLCINTR